MQRTLTKAVTSIEVMNGGLNETDPWLWSGYIAPGNLALLTSLWKAGKTTLLTGLLQQFGVGGTFLGHKCEPARVLVVSEESRQLWAARLKFLPVGSHVRFLFRPFAGQPTRVEWEQLIDDILAERPEDRPHLFVVDPLITFLTSRSDSDAGAVLEFLQSLRRLTEAGLAVLVLHHPRKANSPEGSGARGSGVLLGFVDVILELHRYGRLRTDSHRRRLISLSRHREAVACQFYQWTPGTADFQPVADPHEQQFRDNWETLVEMMQPRRAAATHRELLDDWPSDLPNPSRTQLYEWLNRAAEEGLVMRFGNGTNRQPYRYILPENDSSEERREILRRYIEARNADLKAASQPPEDVSEGCERKPDPNRE